MYLHRLPGQQTSGILFSPLSSSSAGITGAHGRAWLLCRHWTSAFRSSWLHSCQFTDWTTFLHPAPTRILRLSALLLWSLIYAELISMDVNLCSNFLLHCPDSAVLNKNGGSRHPYLTAVLHDSVQLLMWACVGSGFPQLSFISIPSWTNVGFCLMLFLLLWTIWNFPIFSVNMLNVISSFSNINLTLNLWLIITLYICQEPYVYDG